MKAVAVHTYAGGFYMGLRDAGVDLQGSFETWDKPAKMAEHFGVHRLPYGKASCPMAKMTFGNPPCSRFSAMSASFYKGNKRTDLDQFPELNELFKVGEAAQSEIVWWETGPMASSPSGLPMVLDSHKYWKERWGPNTKTITMKIDPLYINHPQKRPRTHVLHFANLPTLPSFPNSQWDPTALLKDFLIEMNPADKTQVYWKSDYPTDAVAWAKYELMREGGFNSCKPSIFDEERTQFARAVIGSRQFVWYRENRLWTLGEYAAVCGWPTQDNYDQFNVGKNNGHSLATVFLSKGVTPTLATWLTHQIFTEPRSDKPVKFHEIADGVHQVKMQVSAICFGNQKLIAEMDAEADEV